MFPSSVESREDIEVLELGEGEKCWCCNYFNAKGSCKAMVVDIEWVL